MSSSLQEVPAIVTTGERRFYPRIVPQRAMYLPLDEKNQALLLNISENGLLVSSQTELPRNFVANVAIPLNGLPRPLQVTVRVVWSNETTMQAGIQLLNLSEHDREQIRRWGAQAFTPSATSTQPVQDQPAAVTTTTPQLPPQEQKRSVVAAMAATVASAALSEQQATAPAEPPLPKQTTNQSLASAAPVEKANLETPTTISRAAADVPANPSEFSWFDKPVTEENASTKKAEWGKLKWPVVIAVLFLSALYLVESGTIPNPFRHSRQNTEETGLAPAPYTPTDQNIQQNWPTPNTPPNTPSTNAFSEPAPYTNVAPQSEDTATPNVLAERDFDNAQVQEEVVPPLNQATRAPVRNAPTRQRDFRPRQQTSRIPAPAPRQYNSANQAPQNRNSIAPVNSGSRSPQIAKSHPPQDNPRTESNEQLIASSKSPTIAKPPVHGNSSPNSSVASDTRGSATGNSTSENSNPSDNWSANVPSTPPSPSYSHQPPAPEAPRSMQPNNVPSSSTVNGSSTANPSVRTVAPSNRTNNNPQPAIVPWKPRSPVIQMDVPERRIVTIHGGDSEYFVNVPGERVLETPVATMRIQRSVRAPKSSSGWLPFHRGKDKEVALGDLASRIDPQVPASQIGPNDFVRVHATIDEDGSVLIVKPIHGPQYLVPVVLNAVRAWRFQPTFLDGQPVETESDIFIQFHPPQPRASR